MYDKATRCPQEDFSPGNITGGPLRGEISPPAMVEEANPPEEKRGVTVGGWQLLQEIGY